MNGPVFGKALAIGDPWRWPDVTVFAPQAGDRCDFCGQPALRLERHAKEEHARKVCMSQACVTAVDAARRLLGLIPSR